MIRNYITIAFRNLMRKKAFSAINIAGLSIGLAVFLLIVLFVQDELSYDRYSAHADRMYRVYMKGRIGGNDIQNAFVGRPAGQALVNDYPFVESATRIDENGTYIVSYKDKKFKEEQVAFADANFFENFSIPLLKGSAKTVLTEPNSVVITQTIAKKYFGLEDPVGKMLKMGKDGLFKVTGVCADVPMQSHFHYTLFASLITIDRDPNVKWLSSGAYTYLLLKEGTRPETFEAKNQEIVEKYLGSEIQEFMGISLEEFERTGGQLGFFLQPITDIHLYSDMENEIEANSDSKYIYIFSAIALFILTLACVNFMNLSTAQSAERAKEVGIRKVLGSVKSQLIRQFLTESILLTVIALLVSFVLVILLLPGFNQLAGKTLSLFSLEYTWLLGGSLLLSLIVGFLAGLYPAFFLSSFQPVSVLKGKLLKGYKGNWLRSSLVVFQFVVSISLLIGTSVVYRQLQYIQNKKLGFDKEQVLIVQDTYLLEKSQAFRNELLQDPQITRASFAGYLPAGASNSATDGFQPEGSINQTSTFRIKTYYIDEEYLPTLGIQLKQGRNFSREFGTDKEAVLINEAAAAQFGFKNPIGQRISDLGDGSPGSKRTHTIIGVVQNFHHESLRHRIAPLVMYYDADIYQIALRVQTNDLPGLIKSVEQTWKKYSDMPFTYSFLDDRFDNMYQAEQKIGQIFAVFACLAIVIACLGLFGLVAFVTAQRTKEIGIRKVLGASIPSIVSLLSKDFIKLVLIAFAIATPLAWYAMHQWLQDFAYQVDIGMSIMAMAGIIALLIALLTVSFQAIKAALADPVRSLRSE
ncbi:FtsX-like permease family protein [Rhodocytophaga rosea]|uniref:FtsX-like permease family protein n=2 Tax=Rhodocytophaga rosea TaxID=2704465 RepID=A0A6C0GVC0_9BACT|nr:FtsX-like permease family protein [Rhodocytophaga rosea]